jgi:hypothetical protein
MRALAVAGLRRGAMVPTVTTRVEQGFPDLQAATWFAWLAPGATPRPNRGALCAELNAVLAEEGVERRVAADAIDIEPSASPEAFGTVLAEDRALSTRGPGREPARTIRLDVADGVAVLSLDRPEVRNAIDNAMRGDEMIAALERVATDPDVRAFVVTGAGGAFCAGGDLCGMLGGCAARSVSPAIAAHLLPTSRHCSTPCSPSRAWVRRLVQGWSKLRSIRCSPAPPAWLRPMAWRC